MTDVARLFSAESAEFISCERPFSNFDLVESRFEGIAPMRRILSQARIHGARTIVIEGGLHEASDLREEDEDAAILEPGFDLSQTEACRVSFFSVPVPGDAINSIPDDAFLGYAIYKKDAITPRVYEAVLKPSRQENNYVRSAPTWACNVVGRTFSIAGHLYAQQNGLTNSCAHVAVRTAAATFLRGDLPYQMMNEWVDRYRASQNRAKRIPGDGLTNDEICHVLERCGARTFVSDFERPEGSPIPYQLRLYSSVESGFPAIVFFGTDPQTDDGETAYHVVPIFGHTFNEDTWAPGAGLLYFPLRKATKCLTSSAWVSMFIGHDDNAGSNYCIPQHYMDAHRTCRDETGALVVDSEGVPVDCRQQGGSVSYAIGTVSGNVQVDPIAAEAIAADYLMAILGQVPDSFPGWRERWQNRLAVHVQDRRLVRRPEGMVLRTSLATGRSYVEHILQVRGWDPEKRIPTWIGEVLSPVVDDPFWMVEVSIPELFSANRRKVGEVLIRADVAPATSRDAGSFLLARLPGCFVLLDADDHSRVSHSASEPSFLYIPVALDDHVELSGCEEGKPAGADSGPPPDET